MKEDTKSQAHEAGLSPGHVGHENHLCELVRRREMGQVAEAAKGATHLCRICGRAANKPENLCEPVKL